jgi:hypothetical protein
MRGGLRRKPPGVPGANAEAPYLFNSLEQLLADFWTAVDDWRK